MPRPNLELVFIGIKGSVVAFNQETGRRVWERKLKGGGQFVSLLIQGDRVLAGTYGEIFCLDAQTGKILWSDGLSGYGYGLMSIASSTGNSDLQAASAELKCQADPATAAAS
ncbi:MAG: hypothetical protein RL380_736 [Verrucomicrobiota bacterium]|jgi:outer membrane protein assembly factor BamB